MNLKKINLGIFSGVFTLGVLIFFSPYIMNTVKTSSDTCSTQHQTNLACKPVIF